MSGNSRQGVAKGGRGHRSRSVTRTRGGQHLPYDRVHVCDGSERPLPRFGDADADARAERRLRLGGGTFGIDGVSTCPRSAMLPCTPTELVKRDISGSAYFLQVVDGVAYWVDVPIAQAIKHRVRACTDLVAGCGTNATSLFAGRPSPSASRSTPTPSTGQRRRCREQRRDHGGGAPISAPLGHPVEVQCPGTSCGGRSGARGSGSLRPPSCRSRSGSRPRLCRPGRDTFRGDHPR